MADATFISHFLQPGDGGTEIISWWPMQSTWETSGLDFGRWTPWCEQWFQKRLDALRCGDAGPYRSNEWRVKIRMFNKVRPLHEALATASKRFVNNNMRVETL